MLSDPSRICAVIVSYHPATEGLERVLGALRPQVDDLVVVDNGSPQETLDWLHRHASQLSFEVIPLGRNTGVASALNQGIAWARERGCTYVLMMDQDSVAQPGMVARLADAHRAGQATFS